MEKMYGGVAQTGTETFFLLQPIGQASSVDQRQYKRHPQSVLPRWRLWLIRQRSASAWGGPAKIILSKSSVSFLYALLFTACKQMVKWIRHFLRLMSCGYFFRTAYDSVYILNRKGFFFCSEWFMHLFSVYTCSKCFFFVVVHDSCGITASSYTRHFHSELFFLS